MKNVCSNPQTRSAIVNGADPLAAALPRSSKRTTKAVEIIFNIFEQWRALATRYDKLALTYRGGAVLGAVSIWRTGSGDTP